MDKTGEKIADKTGSIVEQLEKGAIEPEQQQEWNGIVSSVSGERFSQAVTDAMRTVDPRQYVAHLEAAQGGTNSFGNLTYDQRVGLAQTLVGELAKVGVNTTAISQAIGIDNLDAWKMSVDNLVKLLEWVQVNHPEVLGNVAGRYKDQPQVLANLLGAQTMLAVISNLGARFPAGEAGG